MPRIAALAALKASPSQLFKLGVGSPIRNATGSSRLALLGRDRRRFSLETSSHSRAGPRCHPRGGDTRAIRRGCGGGKTGSLQELLVYIYGPIGTIVVPRQGGTHGQQSRGGDR